MIRASVPVALLLGLAARGAAAQTLAPREERIRQVAAALREDQIGYLQRMVDIPSSTLNLSGVRQVGAMFRASLDSLGFTTRWVDMPDAMRRAGHLVAEHRGREGAARMLLIGHFDTVVEPAGPSFVRQDSMARGIGGSDMKGGDVILLYALRALHQAGALRDLNITVVITGDEESVGDPIPLARQALLDAARASDVALAFEGGNRADATVARRGASSWHVTATGRQAHSSGVFGRGAGFGAVYELARILDAFRREFSQEEYLTMNAATVAGGTDVTYDSTEHRGTLESKLNIVPRSAVAWGDLRFLTEDQKERTRERMRAIVADHLPGTGASILFEDRYPGMAPTPGNARLLSAYDGASRALGHGPIAALDPGRRGAGDISFVAPIVDGLDGLGALGGGSHAPGETVDLSTLLMQTERAAILLARVGAMPSVSVRRGTIP